ncbi:MAG TPA: alpha/beta hydrolase [Paludibacter sp.]|nr:alpha/beta hydrolase [Paludibacter sp.]
MFKGVKILVVVLFVLVGGNLFGQNKIISLWEGKVPGGIPNPTYEEKVDSIAWIKVRFVTNPTIEVYPAPADKNTGTAVVICPGGGYYGLSFIGEGSQIAKWLNSLGITAFVLKYRLPDDVIMKNKSIGPMQDGQRAMRIVRSRAKEWGINPQKIGIIGFSAGGHLASTISTHYNEKVYQSSDTTSARPDFSLLIYPVISMDSTITHMGSRQSLLGNNPAPELVKHFSNELQVTGKTPPAFMVHSIDDGAVPVQNSIRYAMAMREHAVPCELHIYEHGGHGYSLAPWGGTHSAWPEACRKWLEVNGFLAKGKK